MSRTLYAASKSRVRRLFLVSHHTVHLVSCVLSISHFLYHASHTLHLVSRSLYPVSCIHVSYPKSNDLRPVSRIYPVFHVLRPVSLSWSCIRISYLVSCGLRSITCIPLNIFSTLLYVFQRELIPSEQRAIGQNLSSLALYLVYCLLVLSALCFAMEGREGIRKHLSVNCPNLQYKLLTRLPWKTINWSVLLQKFYCLKLLLN